MINHEWKKDICRSRRIYLRKVKYRSLYQFVSITLLDYHLSHRVHPSKCTYRQIRCAPAIMMIGPLPHLSLSLSTLFYDLSQYDAGSSTLKRSRCPLLSWSLLWLRSPQVTSLQVSKPRTPERRCNCSRWASEYGRSIVAAVELSKKGRLKRAIAFSQV